MRKSRLLFHDINKKASQHNILYGYSTPAQPVACDFKIMYDARSIKKTQTFMQRLGFI